MFNDTKEVASALGQQQYIASDEISTVLFLAEKLGKPVLAEGPAGLSRAGAYALGRYCARKSRRHRRRNTGFNYGFPRRVR